jgi:sugar lactone lactonase YvrE
MGTSQKADLLFDAEATLGEGPVWDQRREQLFWVDIEGCKLHRHLPATNENDLWEFDQMIGAVAPKTDGNLLLALETGLATFNTVRGTTTLHNVLENNDPLLRFNDGKCDPNGNFWIGTMHKAFIAGTGNVYRVSPDYSASLQIRNTAISNGMAWSPNRSRFYYIDSPTYQVVSFDFDEATSEISNQKTAINIPESYGSPDGMTIDQEGMLWIAHWGGSCVRRWDPDTGKFLALVAVDAPHVTSCCFGGKDLNMLYITTARSGLNKKELQAAPRSGGLFCIRTEVPGFPVTYFKGGS